MLARCKDTRIRNCSLSNATKTRTRMATRVDYRLIATTILIATRRHSCTYVDIYIASHIAIDLVETLSTFGDTSRGVQPLSRSFLLRYIIDRPVIFTLTSFRTLKSGRLAIDVDFERDSHDDRETPTNNSVFVK